ncbi:MAG: methyl-accepting chemotaxis protein [Desulfobacterales bacterium]|nr:methyl-accepting chemotaxis protein [Desulfobacterales bacterium]
MFRFITKSIMAKLIVQFLLVGLTPLILLGSMTYYYSKDTLRTEAFNHLSSINNIKKEQTLEYLKNRQKNIVLLSRSEYIRKMLDAGTFQEMSPIFDYHMKIFGLSDIIMLNQTGKMLYSAAQNIVYDAADETDAGTNQILSGMWSAIMQTQETMMTDVYKENSESTPVLYMGSPVFSATGDLDAVIIFQINTDRITSLLSDKIGMGETGETYLVGEDFLMRSNSRSIPENAVLKQKVDSKAVVHSLKHQSGTMEIEKDYRGISVLTAYTHLELNEKMGAGFEWAIITQIDQTDAFSLLEKLRGNILWTVLILIFLVGVAGFVQSKIIAEPINDLSYRFVMLNDGDFTVEIPETAKRRHDEIGILIKSFNAWTRQFRKQLKRLMDSTSLLVSSMSRISTTASQLASSASETSSSISEVTTTVEEVKQTSHVATEKAKYVSQSADVTAKISYDGKQATGNTMTGINRIRDEMNYIAESTVQLSDQTKSIEEIINTVSDIADQSNILSVNAAIEAAKAGEHGKGFAVVAQEVKSLADQSKEATNQIRSLLEDIQRATGSAVMATERGIKTVEEAVDLSEQAGDAIDRLSTKVTESAESAMQISASNQQQLAGMDQLSQAMESINDATQQNLEAVKQLEDALKGLEELVQTMNDITSSYKI